MSAPLSNILTEAGTNEVEVLVFELDGGSYGVNVAKVREIIGPLPLTSLPDSHESVSGVFKLRDHVYPLVDLRTYFEMPPTGNEATARIIVTEFNNTRMGFRVDYVDRIHRVNWNDMCEVPNVGNEEDTALTSILHVDDRMILMLDFERIAFRISGITMLEEAAPQKAGNVDRGEVRVLLADDSAMMRKMIGNSLQGAGFAEVAVANDGEDAWTLLNDMVDAARTPDIIVTDIEMPRMDGLHLTKRIKGDARLKQIPIIVFSSLVSDDNLKKCEAVGADRQLTKPELPGLVQIIDELLSERAMA